MKSLGSLCVKSGSVHGLSPACQESGGGGGGPYRKVIQRSPISAVVFTDTLLRRGMEAACLYGRAGGENHAPHSERQGVGRVVKVFSTSVMS